MQPSIDPLEDLQQTLAGILITCMRLYDVQMFNLLLTHGEDWYKFIADKHARGGLFESAPALDPEEIDE